MNAEEIFFYIYNKSFTLIGTIDRFVSLIWSDRYDEAGDFELVLNYDENYKQILCQDYYCTIDYTDRYAVIEKIEIENDDDGNSIMTITGRTIEILLDRRIVLKKTEFGNKKDKNDNEIIEYVQDALLKLFNDNLIEPTDSDRMIPNFIFNKTEDSFITSLTIKETYDKDSLYKIVTDLCKEHHIGFKILLDEEFHFIFFLYRAFDRSDKIIFSQHYGNLNNVKFFSSIEDFKNVMVVSKSDETSFAVSNYEIMPSGIDRREISESASSLSQGSLNNKELEKKAINALNFDHKPKVGFEADIIPGVHYTYLVDYFVGDKVTIEDNYDNIVVAYISEVVITFDEEGFSIIPTFDEISWNEQ